MRTLEQLVRNPLKQKLRDGEVVTSMIVRIARRSHFLGADAPVAHVTCLLARAGQPAVHAALHDALANPVDVRVVDDCRANWIDHDNLEELVVAARPAHVFEVTGS